MAEGFESLGLMPELVNSVSEIGRTLPSDVQGTQDDPLLDEPVSSAAVPQNVGRIFPRISQNQRMRVASQQTGRVLMLPAVAAVKIQACWRAKRIRKRNRLVQIATTEIQRVFRGFIAVKKLRLKIKRHRELEAQERQRTERLKRIRQRERELILLQRLPAEDSAAFLRLRRENSARIVQRAWHRKAGKHWKTIRHQKTKSKTSFAMQHADTDEDGADSTENYWDNDPILHKLRSDISEQLSNVLLVARNLNPNPNYYGVIAEKIVVDALGLAQTHRKVKDESNRKFRQAEKEKDKHFNIFSSTLNGNNFGGTLAIATGDNIHGAELSQTQKPLERGGVRKKYQDLLEYQQKASIMLDDYQNCNDLRRSQKVDRLTSHGRCSYLINQLKNPLSLDQARELIAAGASNKGLESFTDCGKGFLDWVGHLETEGLQEGIDAHIRTFEAMRDKKRWGLVAAPHDVTGPPIDIAVLSRVQEHQVKNKSSSKPKLKRLAGDWADGHDIEESLWWVSYAAQPRRYLSDLPLLNDELDRGLLSKSEEAVAGESPDGGWTSVGKRDTAAQRAASDLVGEVEGEKLLLQLSKQALGASKRREEVVKKCAEFTKRVDRLAKVFEHESLRLLQSQVAGINSKILTHSEHMKRHGAAARIQGLFRGKRDRKLTAKLRAESQLLTALQNLVNVLSRPEMKSSGISLAQIDSALMHRLGAMKAESMGIASADHATPRKNRKMSPNRLAASKSTKEEPHRTIDSPRNVDIVAVSDAVAAVNIPILLHSDIFDANRPSSISAGNQLSTMGSYAEPSAVPFDRQLFELDSPRSDMDDSRDGLDGSDATPIQRMYRKRTKFGSNKEAIAKLNKSSPSSKKSSLVIETPDHKSPPRSSPSGRSPASASASAAAIAAGSHSPSSSMRLNSSSRATSSRQIYTPSSVQFEGGQSPALGSAGAGTGTSTGTGTGTGTRTGVSRAGSRSGGSKKAHRSGHSSTADEFLTEMDDSYDGYVSTPSMSHAGLADSISTMFADLTVGGNNVLSPKPKTQIDFGSSVKGLQFDATTSDRASFTPSSMTMQRTLQRSMQRPHSANSYGQSAHISLRCPPMSTQLLQAFAKTGDNFKKGQCRASDTIDSALLAKMTRFDKGAALLLLKQIVGVTGVEQLRIWLESFANSVSNISLEASTGSAASDISDAYRVKVPDLTTKAAANLLIDLAFELQLLNESDRSMYIFINLCMLLHLLSGGGAGRVKLAELLMLAEDMWLVESDADGLNVSFLLAQSRYSLLHESTRSATPVSALFESIVMRVTGTKKETTNADSTESLLSTVFLSVPQLVVLFQALGLQIHPSEAVAIIHLIENSNEANAVRSDNLRSYLCSLCSFRMLQQRLKIWFRAVPDMLASANKEIASLIGEDATMKAVPFEKFCEAIQRSNIPLSESETFMLAKLFSRSNSNILNDTGDIDATLLESVKKGSMLSIRLQ